MVKFNKTEFLLESNTFSDLEVVTVEAGAPEEEELRAEDIKDGEEETGIKVEAGEEVAATEIKVELGGEETKIKVQAGEGEAATVMEVGEEVGMELKVEVGGVTGVVKASDLESREVKASTRTFLH